MKNKIIYLFAASALVAASCNKVVDTVPVQVLTTDLAFSTAARIESSTLAGYDGLQSAEFLSGRALIYVDLMGEDVVDKNLFFGDLSRADMLSNNGTPQAVWNAGYNSIARANRAIAGITANSGLLTAAKAASLIAEAKFIRAISHFYLVNFFGQPYGFTADASHPGVPLITDSYTTNDPAANKPRSTVKQVYDQVIADLTEGIANLPATQSNVYNTKVRATKAAAAALLARVNLYKGDYANARTLSGAIIAGTYGAFALNAAPDGAFGPGRYQTAETIWSIPNNVNDNPNTNNALPQHYMEGGRNDLAVSPTFTNIATNPYFAADDRRRNMILPGVSAANSKFRFTQKFPDIATRSDWAPILRYAEVLLTNAEAAARLGSGVDAGAVTTLNLVRNRARVSAPAYTTASFASQTELIDAILGERRIELAFEGHRAWDLFRVKRNATGRLLGSTLDPIPNLNYGSNKAIFPIPQVEIDKSAKVLVQSLGY